MILVIDDLRTFNDRPDVQYARTSTEGLAALERAGDIKELWLDHDLGLNFKTRCEDNIMPVVRRLVERAAGDSPYSVKRIFVHTSNPYSRDSMIRQLSPYYFVESRVAIEHGLEGGF